MTNNLFMQIKTELYDKFKLPVEVIHEIDREGHPVSIFTLMATGLALDELMDLNRKIREFRCSLDGDLEPLGERVLMRAEAA